MLTGHFQLPRCIVPPSRRHERAARPLAAAAGTGPGRSQGCEPDAVVGRGRCGPRSCEVHQRDLLQGLDGPFRPPWLQRRLPCEAPCHCFLRPSPPPHEGSLLVSLCDWSISPRGRRLRLSLPRCPSSATLLLSESGPLISFWSARKKWAAHRRIAPRVRGSFLMCNRLDFGLVVFLSPKCACAWSMFQFGPCFSFTMFGTEVTYLLGSEASANFWGSHNDHLNAEDLYANITVPYALRAPRHSCLRPVWLCCGAG